MKTNFLRCCLLALVAALPLTAAENIRVLIIDGRNNHDWVRTTAALKETLEAAGGFKVDVSTSPPGLPGKPPAKPKDNSPDAAKAYEAAVRKHKEAEAAFAKAQAPEWEKWRPRFADYQVVVSNYNGTEWPEAVKQDFVRFTLGGGGVVVVHAANNAFAGWEEYNEMICFGWRGATFMERVAVDDASGRAIAVPADQEKVTGNGFGSGHGPRHAFVIKGRDADHPIQKGLPGEWLHATDELYHRMRGSPDHAAVVQSAYSEPEQKGTGLHEPMMWWSKFGEGRVVTTSMGHLGVNDPSLDALHCVGFQTVFARAVEWTATGKVTLAVPAEFPTKDKTSVLEPSKVSWKRQ